MSTKVYSLEAVHVVRRAYELGFRVFSDPNWSLLEAFEKETPTGEVHLHWKNHRGRGHWELITHYKRTSVCNTARCRVVTIIPHGGEHEACDISRQRFDEAFQTWLDNKSLDDVMRHDVEAAMNRERERRRLAREAIEKDFGPWPYGEQPTRWHSVKWGMWMHELDAELSEPAALAIR